MESILTKVMCRKNFKKEISHVTLEKEGTSFSFRQLHGDKVDMKRLLVQLKLLPNLLRTDTTSSSFLSVLKSIRAATKPHKKSKITFSGLTEPQRCR